MEGDAANNFESFLRYREIWTPNRLLNSVSASKKREAHSIVMQ